jgi:hypothetical protein
VIIVERITKEYGKNIYAVASDKLIKNEKGYTGEAIYKLAIFENIYENLEKSQIRLSEELDKLRSENKTNTYKFKELMAKKLSNSFTISLFKSNGL